MPENRWNVKLTGDWDKALAATDPAVFKRKFKAAIMRANYQEAWWLHRKLTLGIVYQNPGGKRIRPLSDVSLQIRAKLGIDGTKALIARGTMYRAINVEPKRPAKTVFVGISRKSKARGRPLVNVAMVQEFGARIRVTPKMRGYWFHTFGIRLKKSTRYIVIPPRPVFTPVLMKYYRDRSQVENRIMKRVVKAAAGLLGS